jgi:hypothetical protein
MSEETIVQAPVEQPPVAEVPKEFVYKYQPRDENGNGLGGEQVIKYDGTPEDLGNKMAAQNSELVKLNRRLNKDLKLSSVVQDTIPADAPRFDESKFQLQPVPLSAEERIEISRQLTDPETFDVAAQRLVKSQIGDPEALRVRLARLEEKSARDNALAEAESFRRANPGYYVCPDNFTTLAGWMLKNGLDPVQSNFQLAYDNLKDYLTPRPEAPKPAPVPEPVAVVEPQPQPAPRPSASGLTRNSASDSGPTRASDGGIVYEYTPVGKDGKPDPYAQKQVYTGRKALDVMPAEEYKRRILHEKGFREKVDALDRAKR